jgi:Flp pilus assembly protein TadD
MRITIISALFLLASLNLNAQADYGNKGEAIQLCKALQGSQFSNYREANSAIEDILSVIGAKNRFVVQPCDNINNAAAVTMQGIRYIFFDPNFMNSISSGRYSSNLFILAHEVGHHINGHSQDIVMLLSDYAPTSNTLSEGRVEELEADEFAGFIMGKLGHSLSSMQNTLRGVADNGDDTYSTHPSLSKRLKAVETGYNKAKGNEVLKTNVTSSKQTAEEYFDSAYFMADLADHYMAVEDYNKAIQLNPNNASAYNNRGVSKDNLEDYRGAIEDYNKAIQLNPNNAGAYNNRGVSKDNLEDYRGAIEDFNKAIQLNPNDAGAYKNRGVSKRHLEDYRGASEDFSKAGQLDLNMLRKGYNMGKIKRVFR